ncbi:MAG: TIGR04283 family arsenosugar biosynthesis glycosyltransferase [Candidatus Poribacteria bacterium]|nr:TIGR04283 family arsenosugar biosynthesis glycosyltransferase [Candidatus Poribacteria bacterium]MDE0503437.1 TIGR04283 family arsenosugar biosynthesis glycosyltransferase [Candidatus Poribacteria bacterium]
MISVVIPTLNEAAVLDSTLSRLTQQLDGHELLIVDGGSTDCTRQIARKYGNVISSGRGRACQLNAGANAASGATFLFLHADVELEPGAVQAVEAAVAAGYVGGAFRQRIDGAHPLYRIIEFAANLRAKHLKVYYGDGGIFIGRTHFRQIGGFPDLPIMEEIGFSRELRRLGKTTLVKSCIHISSRRWEQNGIIRTTLINWLITLLFLFGISPTRLAKMYRHVR